MESGGQRRSFRQMMITRLIDALGWLLAASAGLLMISQAIGWNGNKFVATLHALMPFVILGTVPVAALACWRQRNTLAITTSLIGLGGLILASPLVFEPTTQSPAPDATEIRAAAVNLLFTNPVIDDAANNLRRRDIDVILFTEYTRPHQAELLAHPLADDYPYKIDRYGLLAGGIALWSKYPISENVRPITVNYTLDIDLDGPDGPIRVFGVHPPTPVFFFGGWVRDLDTFGRLGSESGAPVLMFGDFNASYWHPPFRDLLGQGLTDAHTAHGKGLTNSWPTDEIIPAFVRLDHALTGNGLVSTAVEDFDVPGSDHRGFVVTVATAR